MANPTTNFGWVMPTSTSLVTNLPADFNTFGQGVDTSMAQLKGGTTGQILSKTSATDMAFTWITPNPGDITGVTAGTGISGGGTSGDVTITNSMATAMTTKGDLVPATGSGTFSRLAVGTNGQTLVADSSTATGLKWAAAAVTPTFAGASVYNSALQTIANNTYTALTFDTEQFDTNAFHSTATNTSRFTIPASYAGKYLINAQVLADNNATGKRAFYFYKNGAGYLYTTSVPASTIEPSLTASYVADLAVGDYVEVFYWQNSGASRTVDTRIDYCRFSISYLGA